MPLTMTLRLDDAVYEDVMTMAKVQKMTVTDVIREAIDEYIARRKADPEFQQKLRAYIDEQQRVYERLAA